MKLAFHDARAAAGSTNGALFDRGIEIEQAMIGQAGYAARFVHVEVVFDETSLVWPGNLRAFAVQPGGCGRIAVLFQLAA